MNDESSQMRIQKVLEKKEGKKNHSTPGTKGEIRNNNTGRRKGYIRISRRGKKDEGRRGREQMLWWLTQGGRTQNRETKSLQSERRLRCLKNPGKVKQVWENDNGP